MDKANATLINTVINQLDRRYPDGKWLSLLSVLGILGVADMLQIQQHTGMSRDEVRSVIQAMFKAVEPKTPILRLLDVCAARAGIRGRAPQVYCLCELGSRLLKARQQANDKVCELKDEHAIIHRVLMLDVRLAALRDQLSVQTDAPLLYETGKSIRPDNLVEIAPGHKAIFEVEQHAQPEWIGRIIQSLQHKAAYFNASRREDVSPVVRMLVNSTRGRDLERSIRIWRQAMITVANQAGPLKFRLLVMPLGEFLAQPDWQETPDVDRWVEIASPEVVTENVSSGMQKVPPDHSRLPQRLMVYSNHETKLMLEAQWEYFRSMAEHDPRLNARPDPDFFEIMRLIYLPSHSPDASALDKAAFPYASLYCLKEYLNLHPELKTILQRSINRGNTEMRWTTPNIMHRMQVVADRFLAYHNWRNGGPLAVSITSPVVNAEDALGTFGVTALIRTPEILKLSPEQVTPSKQDVEAAQAALSWVVWSLFAYASYIDIQPAAFW